MDSFYYGIVQNEHIGVVSFTSIFRADDQRKMQISLISYCFRLVQQVIRLEVYHQYGHWIALSIDNQIKIATIFHDYSDQLTQLQEADIYVDFLQRLAIASVFVFIGLLRYIRIGKFQCILIKIMIAAIRVTKYIGFSWFRLCSPFSSEKMKYFLSQSAQRAVWSSTIVRTICNAQGSEIITDPSLREKLLNLRHPADSISDPVQKDKMLSLKYPSNEALIFDPQIRDWSLRIFSEGVQLPNNVFKQKRIILAKEPETETTAKFIFCPNLLVTQPMFRKLRFHKTDILIYGAFGISKTAAIVLFNHLSSISNQFVYQSSSDGVLKQELKFLRANSLITDIPKLFYWSLDINDDQDKLKSLIIAQATELSEQQRIQLSKIAKFSQFIKYVWKKYEDKGITVHTVIDQVNVLASIFRKWNNFILFNKENSQQWKIKLNTQIKKRQLGEFLRSLTKEYKKLGSSTFYNSSIHIEQNLIAVQDKTKEYTIDIEDNHQPMPKYRVEYTKGLNEKWGRNDFSHILWFEIQKRLKQTLSLEQNILKRLKTALYEKVKDYRWPKYLRFLNIRLMFEKKEIQLQNLYSNLNQITTLKKNNIQQEATIANTVTESVCSFVNLLLQSSIDDFRNNLAQFLCKTDSLQVSQTRTILFFALLSVAQKCIDQKELFQVQTATLYSILQNNFQSKQKSPDKPVQIQEYFGQSSKHKELFQLQQKNGMQIIKFLWTPEQFITVVKWVLLSSISDKQYFDPNIAKFLTQKRQALGNMLESSLCFVLTVPKTKAKFLYQNSKRQLQTFDSDGFVQFNKGSSTIPLNCGKLLQKAKQNPDEYIFGYPIMQKTDTKTKKIIQIHASKSKCFDGMYILYNPSTEIFEIYSFDITVSRKSIPEKVKDAQQFLKNNLDISEQYRWHHTILCPKKKKAVYKFATRKDGKTIKWIIQTSPLQQFQVKNPDPNNVSFKKRIRIYNTFRNIYERDQRQKSSRRWK